ncbi:hypothetical protein OG875_08110 [Streptomyces sp. NBC_01498]|uniref:DUF6879 family protein n=1 Tax=Streptomyces sp. NBC_01498 TaxID=2975870 RepID=UPI002E7C4CAE|nr:DUF6879 family protein [Streptomyces sp. NBC_01498]WTL24568.1 hypothetical protein OG875_08110 [Streptomyces sp. NBC_01498]
MSEPHVPVLLPEQGERLVREEYRADFRERSAALRHVNSWKLERRQHFEEQGSPSRDALRRGEWEESLRLMRERGDSLAAAARQEAARGHVFHRVRVVEAPLTPYVQWELHSLRQQAGFGTRVRVVSAESVAAAEGPRPLPEVVILGGRTLFNVLYSGTGHPQGAIRFTRPDVVAAWEHFVASLYASGEDIASYFARSVAHLPAPTSRTE